MKTKLPPLPVLLHRKIYKTGQTRGADDDVIFQNRVGRNSTVLIPYKFADPINYPTQENKFEKDFIVLIPPEIYFSTKNIEEELKVRKLTLGINCLIFYETRQDWDKYNPELYNWRVANNRTAPLGGEYIARVPATTAIENGEKINRGFNTTKNKGAGIRQFEYASLNTIKLIRLQLEAIYWLAYDSVSVAIQNGMNEVEAKTRKIQILNNCEQKGLLEFNRLIKARILDGDKETNCPLCREKISGLGFFNRLSQAEGREVPDITVTEINLFHIEELRFGVYNHKPYNLGWGHHHCNVVTKDTGIVETLIWMQQVLDRNNISNIK